MLKQICLLTFMIISLAFSCAENQNFETAVHKSVERQIRTYPRSTLKDLYKSFFQDRFGPGHIINDRNAARSYLLRELTSYSEPSGEMYEPTGWQHNFYRVNLDAVKAGFVSSEILLDALIRSANAVKPVTVEEWREEWARIETVIRSMNLSIPDYESDLADINSRLKEGNYVGHHSEAYGNAYDPHYRIIDRDIFEKEILSLLK